MRVARTVLGRGQRSHRSGKVLTGGKKLLRILKTALNQYFKMQMRPGGATCGANFGNFLAPFDQIALFYPHFGGMGIASDQIVAMIDFDHVAVFLMVFLRHHHTAGRRQNSRALW